MKSLGEIRQTLVDKQVELADLQDGALFLLVEAMSAGIRQFTTFEELLRRDTSAPPHPRFSDFRRPLDTRQADFDGLEVLRAHLIRCLGQIAVIARMPALSEGVIAHYQGPWQLEAYTQPTELEE